MKKNINAALEAYPAAMMANELLDALKAILDAGHFDDDGDFYVARHSADVYAATPDMLPPDQLIEKARSVVDMAEGRAS